MAVRNPATPAAHLAPPAPPRPSLANKVSLFILLEREVEQELRPVKLAALQAKVDALARAEKDNTPSCCGRPMGRHDSSRVSWRCRLGRITAVVVRWRCRTCQAERRPLLNILGVEPGRISGSLARILGLLGAVVPYSLAAELAGMLLACEVNAMTVWRAVQRLGEAADGYEQALATYHNDSRSEAAVCASPPAALVVGVDGCCLGMQVRQRRRRRTTHGETLPPLPKVEEGHYREVKTGVVLLPRERYQPSPGRHALLQRVLVTCLGDADAVFARLWARLQELGWLGPATVVVIVGDGAEWIWKRAEMFAKRCEILDFWHAIEHAWELARVLYGEGSQAAEQWIASLAHELHAGKVESVIVRLKDLSTSTPEAEGKLNELIRYYTNNANRMRYDIYLRFGYGIGSGAVESAHKQVVHARMRLAGMRWSEAGARRLLALRLLLLNHDWARLDRLPMAAIAA